MVSTGVSTGGSLKTCTLWECFHKTIDYKLLDNLIEEQRKIFDNGYQYLKKSSNARIVYSTCSILKRENEEQVKYFLSKYSDLELENTLSSLPKSGELDGFFCAIFKRSKVIITKQKNKNNNNNSNKSSNGSGEESSERAKKLCSLSSLK